MSANHVSLESLQPLVDKEAVLHIIQDDGSTVETPGVIMAATPAGVPFKPKGKANVELLTIERIYEASAAPNKPKSISQKKLKPITSGGMRSHLADRHGVSLAWCRENTEEAAMSFHDSMDHDDIGHKHVAEPAKEAAVDIDSPDPVEG